MKISPSLKIFKLINEYPFLLDFMVNYNPKYQLLKNKSLRITMGRMATLKMVASVGNIDIDKLINDINDEILDKTGERLEITKEENDPDKEYKINELKKIIEGLHSGTSLEIAKKQFDELTLDVDPSEIALMEEELIRNGMPAEAIQKLCDVHVDVFKRSLDKNECVEVPENHPIHTYIKENSNYSASKVGEGKEILF